MSDIAIFPFLRGFLSQWHPSNFTIDGKAFNCAEQYMMFCKANLFQDTFMTDKIMKSEKPSDHKRLGQQVRNFDAKVWETNKKQIVFTGNLAKFSQNAGLKKKLLATKDSILVEANPKDIIWGVGLSEFDPDIQNPALWRGENLLGTILMEVREKLSD